MIRKILGIFIKERNIKTDITWDGDYAAHFVNNMMSQGACLIDEKGVIKMDVTDSAS